MENKQLYIPPLIRDKDYETEEAIRYVLNVFDTLRTICERNTYEILNKYDDNEYLSNSMTVDFKYKPNSNDVKIYVHPIILTFDKAEHLTEEVFNNIKKYMDHHFGKIAPIDNFEIYFMVNPKDIKLGEEHVQKPYAKYVYSQIKSSDQNSRGDNIAKGDKIITPFTIRYEFSSGSPHHKLKIIKETSHQTKYMSERLNLFSDYLNNN